jgi:ligand-binding sensor domain-containing protein/DNA-binding CsgD family transcriptional regulator
MIRQTFALLLISLSFLGFSQNPIGMPDIVNYDNSTYGGGTHNWDIQQDKGGVIYFANDEGLLTFDGSRWKIYPLPNKTIVRSIKIANDGRIYVGGQGDFGYFSPNESGNLTFYSLKKQLLYNHTSFADIWDIETDNKAVYFRAENYIFKWYEGKMQTYKPKSKWVYMGRANNQLLAQEEIHGLFVLENEQWKPIGSSTRIPALNISASTSFAPNVTLLSSLTHGLLTLQNGLITPFSKAFNILNTIQTSKIDQNTWAVATLDNGCYIIDNKGSKIYHLDKTSGLQSNSVLSIFKDSAGNIWLGLADGISLIANNNAIKHINPSVFDNAAGHTSVVHQNRLVVGLSNGFYSLNLSSQKDISLEQSKFTPIANASGQAWGANIVGQKLFLGRHEGAFELANNLLEPVARDKGYWNFISYQRKDGSLGMLAGNYTGIATLKKVNNNWVVDGSIKNFNESARFIETDAEGNIWVSHPYKGIYKISENKIALYTDKNGLPSTYNNHIYKIRNRIVTATEKGIFEFDRNTEKFQHSTTFKDVFQRKYIRYLKEDDQGNIWFMQGKNLGVAQLNGKTYHRLYIPELNSKILGGFENINYIDKNNVIIGAQKGFYHLNYEKYLANDGPMLTRISSVKAFGRSDSTLFGGYFGDVNEQAKQHTIPIIKNGWNSLHFEFSSPISRNKEIKRYSCMLQGFDDKWSSPDEKTEKDYTKLPAGDYIFKVKTIDNLGNESPEETYAFTILPPLYLSLLAKILYGFMLLCIAFYIYKVQQKKIINQQIAFEKEQEHVKYMHQLEMDKSEKEIIKLKNEKLELAITTQNSELATTAMHLVQKADLLTKIKAELFKLKKDIKNDEAAADFNKMIRMLNTEEAADDSWDQFSVNFDKVHVDFIKHLKEEFPNISGTELRLSAYLKMNLSTKEIAKLMKISPRGVEIGRYRLRKKLNLPNNSNLFEFFNSF